MSVRTFHMLTMAVTAAGTMMMAGVVLEPSRLRWREGVGGASDCMGVGRGRSGEVYGKENGKGGGKAPARAELHGTMR